MTALTVVSIRHGSVSIDLKAMPDFADQLLELALQFEQLEFDGTPGHLELFALFLEFCVQHSNPLALLVFEALNNELRADKTNIHVAIQQQELSEERARAIIRAYYSLWDVPDACALYQAAVGHPALLSSASTHLMALFGGQRGTGSCLDEARWMLQVYKPLVYGYVQRMSEFLCHEAQDSRVVAAYPRGLHVLEWLTVPNSAPDARYIETMPIMLPVIGLTQLMQVMVLFKTLFMSPGELVQKFKAFSMMTTEDAFEELSAKILGIQMLVGALPQLGFPYYKLNPLSVHDCAQLRKSTPYPMVLVQGITQPVLEQHMHAFNGRYDTPTEHAYLAVCNSTSQFIITGVTLAVAKFAAYLCSQSALVDEDQSRVPYSKRKPVIRITYLQISSPYHCDLLGKCVDPIYNIVQEKQWMLKTSDMQVCVRACDNDHDICNEKDITHYLLQSMCVLPVNWPQAIAAPDVTHMVDFGPGGFDGFGQLAFKNVEGRGIPVICAGALLSQSTNSSLGSKANLYQPKMSDVITVPNWLTECGPRLVRTAHDNKVHIDTRMHRVLGMPTVMIAGMTPTTVNEQFVAAINNAGYHAEIAGGGMHTEGEMVDKLQALTKLVGPGRGITLNCIYISPQQWGFQFPALLRMRNKGFPIAGLCIGGGVPSLDQALEIINSLRAAGIRHVSFKPSTAETIRHVVRVARASRGFPIVLQWTGGRGGGHHSFEDFHQPILETYAAIRSCNNIALVAGSGFGDAEGTLPYVTGDWSIAYGRAPMPFDGILLGSRVMVSKEAGTSPAAKQLIVDTAGLLDSEWDRTYDGAHNGVTTITSEYGEMNHVIATRGAMFIREMYDTVLNQPREKHEKLLLANKDKIISRLNNDYMRPWFGRKTDGRVVDLEEMTYTEVIGRAVELMYIQHQRQWTHESQRTIVIEFVERCECRMSRHVLGAPITVMLGDIDPSEYADLVSNVYPEAATTTLLSEDAEFFKMLCKRRGQKSPMFVVDLGKDFGLLIQKDSIWPSENLDAVVDQDPQRVGIQQGPVAARYSTVVDEPVKTILDTIYHKHIAALKERLYGGDESSIPVVEYLCADPVAVDLPGSVTVRYSESERVFVLPEDTDKLPDTEVWLQAVAGPCKSWLQAWLAAPVVLHGTKYTENKLRRLLRSRPGRTVSIRMIDGIPQTLQIVGANGQLEFKLEHSNGAITQSFFQPAVDRVATLRQRFAYTPATPLTPIAYLEENDVECIRRFIAVTWVDNSDEATKFQEVTDPNVILHSNGITITKNHILKLGGIINQASGKVVTILGTSSVCGKIIATTKSEFLYNGYFIDYTQAFMREHGQRIAIRLPSDIEVRVLETKDWFIYREDAKQRLTPNAVIEFCLDSAYRYKNSSLYSSVVTTGTVAIKTETGRLVHIADVDYQCTEARKNFAIEYIRQFEIESDSVYFDNGGYALRLPGAPDKLTFAVPESNNEYARVSSDKNPIHVNPYVADIAGLPAPITHGQYTCAATRALIESCVADRHPERFRKFHTEYVGMVLPRDVLHVELNHTGMRCGRMLIEGRTLKVDETPVMTFVAEIEQPATAYVFTGQGSQHVNMGMQLYESSSAARAVWDRANKHMVRMFGMPLIELVRSNTSQHTVYFEDEFGEFVLANYLAVKAMLSENQQHTVLSMLDADTLSYTVTSPTGLLNATQITQPALVAFAFAAIADMQAHGLIQINAVFAGHSLGELSALATLSNVFTLEDILDLALFRGLLMQSAVRRDEQGNSGFGMVAVNPSRIGANFNEDTLHQVIEAIQDASSDLIQLVNYNVHEQQYVVAGTLANLAVLRVVLDDITGAKLPVETGAEFDLRQVVDKAHATTIDPTPVRGVSTTPLEGIDMPFHSHVLLDSVPAFRDALNAKLSADSIPLDALCNRYIPNLTGIPFAVTYGYFELVHTVTCSPVASEILGKWTDDALEDPAEKARLGCALLVELLAYQLASPVQWIKIQDHLFGAAEIERVIEIGPSPVLCNMAARTVASLPHIDSSVLLLHIERDRDDIYYVHAIDETEVAVDAAKDLSAPVVVPTESSAVEVPQKLPVESQPHVGGSAPINDTPLQAIDTICAIIAFKIKQPLSSVSTIQSIKAIVSGKSILQNEILGDLHKEFASKVPDKAEDMSLNELGATVGTSSGLGKCTQPLVTRMLSSKMPGGFSATQVRSNLQTVYGLGQQRQDALLLMALTMEPPARLSSNADAEAWLATVAQAYAAHTGIVYSAASATSSDGALKVSTVSSVELQNVRQREIKHIQQQIVVLARYAGIDLRQDGRLAESLQASSKQQQTNIDSITVEFGDELITGVQPRFDARKARQFDSYWNWARQDAYEWIQQTIAECITGVATDVDVSDKERLQQLQNRADLQLVQMLAGTVKILSDSHNNVLQPAIQLAQVLHDACKSTLSQLPVYRELSGLMQPKTYISASGEASYTEIPRASERTWTDYIGHMSDDSHHDIPPHIHLCEKSKNGQWSYDKQFSSTYYDGLSDISQQGTSFVGRTALVTGCGRGSIGAEIVRSLLMGGAKVLATTSSYSRQTTLFFEDIYRKHGSRGSELIVVPFNQGSVQDIDSLVTFVFGQLGWGLDYVFPFAAVSDIGSTVDNLGSHSELAHRVMLTNVLRLLGCIKLAKTKYKSAGRPTLVVLPLSPNHGDFGGDGLYGESKIALETTFNRWKSEMWRGHISIAGAVIGWTRGTGLMSANNLVAESIENAGVRTFSPREMAFNIIGLLNPRVTRVAHRQPVWTDLSGGLNQLTQLNAIVDSERSRIKVTCEVKQRILQDTAYEVTMQYQALFSNSAAQNETKLLAKLQNHFPATKRYEDLQNLHYLQGMVNLDKVVVVTGYGEVGPHGNANTRWEFEAFGELSTEGCIELAWIMGLIKHHNGLLPATGQHYIGWVDAKSNELVLDADIKQRYHEYILAHTGIRLIEPELTGGYDPNKKMVLREVSIEHDMEPFEASADEAAAFKQSNGDKVDIWKNGDSGSWSVRFLKGALIRVPAAVSTDRLVAGLLPTGWNAKRFGIPDDVVKQVDPVTLFTLVSTVEALVRSGITDPYELYQHIHISEIGNTVGCAVGGSSAIQDVFGNRQLDKDVKSDIMQEVFISTVQAWVNMLLISGSGPVKPSVGACATGVLSVDTAVEVIQSDKAKIMLAGGVDDFVEESSTDFAKIGATSNSVEELAMGREPSEMCRPCTSTRSGFVEGQGGGVAVLMSASTAIAIGAPIYGVIAMSSTATDKQGQSVPAPGQGMLTTARESDNTSQSRLLDIGYRKRKLELQLRTLDAWKQGELDELLDDASVDSGLIDNVETAYLRQRAALLDTWSTEFWKYNPNISPLRGSLAVWGLTADDIGMASFHGTSTQANDKNESEVINAQLTHIGRTPGHVVPVVCQKWLTGHAKGGAASLMLNGILQSLRTGLIPGNRNADNIAAELKQYEYPLYLSQTVQTTGIKAALLTSFGFGQVGGELLVLHPDFVLATLERSVLEEYNKKLEVRRSKSFRYWQDTLMGKHSFVQVKHSPPFTPDQEQSVYLDPLARAHFDSATNEYWF
ncbi:fatty acid synthase alpha subunit Lsd1 [Coemansia sp. RSA 521]|nr:fatty acid synthase alpha subunit Lsd1 [Coemansia sp. RSA 521]